MKIKWILFCIVSALIIVLWQFTHKTMIVWNSSSLPSQIVIDIGHGGNDPGKVGVNQALEKDINLAIGLYLKEYLSAAGYSLILTRESDMSLADSDASNQKLSDLKNRAALIERAAPSAVISIHQNSYPQETVNGAQVFHSGSTESELLASYIQEQCRRILDPDNKRLVKQNPDYYLFRHTACPIVIVECGFLSNYKEANLLITEDYQRKTAWAIYMGTVQFLQTLE
ncbi:MAG: N-acetylmuramoyl-L-alanine amidase [Lachnospiraceae bacterium]|nr:N-acetylmuramoyl-L-alanine amidase [Lachnospiraceae bacterium]